MKLTEEDYIQALDYSNVMLASFTNTMETCEAIKSNKAIKKSYNKVVEAMAELYQTIGKESGKDE